MQSEQPIYLKPVNKKRQINFDEELLVIFFSILNYISDTYGFPKDIKCQFQLIKGAQFKTYLNGYGRTRLRQIKYKYFSDKALELWNLCYAFFDEARQVFVSTEKKEYLLVKSFYIVFEAIIDELIGDNPLPDDMEKNRRMVKSLTIFIRQKVLLKAKPVKHTILVTQSIIRWGILLDLSQYTNNTRMLEMSFSGTLTSSIAEKNRNLASGCVMILQKDIISFPTSLYRQRWTRPLIIQTTE